MPQSRHSKPPVKTYESHSLHLVGVISFRNLCDCAANDS